MSKIREDAVQLDLGVRSARHVRLTVSNKPVLDYSSTLAQMGAKGSSVVVSFEDQ